MGKNNRIKVASKKAKSALQVLQKFNEALSANKSVLDQDEVMNDCDSVLTTDASNIQVLCNNNDASSQAVNNDECAAAQQDYLPATRETIEIRQHDADRLIAKNGFAPILTPERIKPAPMHHVITNVTDGPCLIGNTNIKLTDPYMIAGEIGSDKPTRGKDKSKRQPRKCKKCIQCQGLNSSSWRGRSGKGGRESCEYFNEDGTAR